jgi:hypothetical protein
MIIVMILVLVEHLISLSIIMIINGKDSFRINTWLNGLPENWSKAGCESNVSNLPVHGGDGGHLSPKYLNCRRLVSSNILS